MVGFVACGLASLSAGQDDNWDLRNYHYYNPYAFITDRLGFDFAPAQRQSYLNPFPDLPFYLGATHLNPKLFGFLMGGMQGLSFGLLFAVCFLVLRGFGPNTRLGLSVLCSGLGLYAPIFVGELGGSQNDTLIGLFVLASTVLLARTLAAKGSLAQPESRRTLGIASLLLGMGVGLKLTFMLHAPAVAVAILIIERTWSNRVKVLAAWSVAFLVGFLITNGYWMARLWQEFGNPFFPFYNNIFESPWAEARSFADHSVVPATVWEALARPFAFTYENRYTNLQGFRDARYALLYVLLASLAIVWVCRRFFPRNGQGQLPFHRLSPDSRFLLAFFVVSFVVWEASFCIIRYASTLEMLAPLLIVVVTCDLTGRATRRTVIIAAMFVSMAVIVRPIENWRVEWGNTFWEVQVPPIKDPKHSLIVIANSRPWAYLVPMFPPEVRWVSLNNNLISYLHPTGMQAEIRRLLIAHRGDLYLLSTSPRSIYLEHDRTVLANYGLSIEPNSGRPIVSKHSVSGLQLWSVRRK